VEKACVDRALCVLLVPVALLAQYWGKFLLASAFRSGARAQYADGFGWISDLARYLHRTSP
jgi:hypothetical protein